MRCVSIIVVSALCCACKSDLDAARSASSAKPSAPTVASSSGKRTQERATFEGIYAVDRITTNRSGCESEGPVVDPEVKFYYLRFADSFGHRILTGGGQTSRAECIQLAKKGMGQVYHPVVFTEALDSAEPKGNVGQSAMPKDGICDSEADALLLRQTGPNGIRIELRTTHVSYPGKEISDCGSNDSIEAAVGKPCRELTVIEAHRDGDLPTGK